MASAVTPASYQKDKDVLRHEELLWSYLRARYEAQPLQNKVMLLWADRNQGFFYLSTAQRESLLKAIAAKQNADGGWSLNEMAGWKRHDTTSAGPQSDGCGTGLVLLALFRAGLPANDVEVDRGLRWLESHQDATTGAWPGYSPNHQIDPAQPGAQFMTDAATGFASLALVEYGR
jgi:squalene-hopene/tetraprenyl-beta-curcumene cyclase